MASKNASIGTCPCPFRGCEHVTSVFKFRGRSDNPARHRYAGRLYCVCPTHGRIESQEWILENARIEMAAVTDQAPVAPVADQSPAAGAKRENFAAASSAPPATARVAEPLKVAAASRTRSVTTSSDAVPATERARERWGFFE